MIYLRFRDGLAPAHSRTFPDEEYPEALMMREEFQERWKEVWMYLEGESDRDWVMLFDSRGNYQSQE